MRGAFEVVRSQKTPPPKNSPLTLHIQDQGAEEQHLGLKVKREKDGFIHCCWLTLMAVANDTVFVVRGGAKNAYVAIRSQHKFMLRLHVAITCCDLMLQSDVHFSVGFPVFAVKYFSKLEFCIYDCLFLGWISCLRC